MERNLMILDAPGKILMMTGNEAIARGAVEAGVQVAAAYPGTPSTEILENIALATTSFPIHVEWSVNEKVAFEVAFGASMTGKRTLASMKHEGLNVMLDSLSKMIYTGVKGGLLLVVCDDPNATSSSNEQDSRAIAQFVDMLVLEPSSPDEAKKMVIEGYMLSENFRTPIMIRSVTRISHGKSGVELGPILREDRIPYFDRHDGIKERWFCCAFNHLEKHRAHHQTMKRVMEEFVEITPWNRIEGDSNGNLGIVTSGITYNIIEEVLEELGLSNKISILKIGTPYPLPYRLVQTFLKRKEKIIVFEEGDPVIEMQLRAYAQNEGMKISIFGQFGGVVPRPGELTFERCAETLNKVFNINMLKEPPEEEILNRRDLLSIIPKRALTMCPGCPHRATHYALMKALEELGIKKPIILGDIGCYELSHEPPFENIDSIYNMGAGVGLANGLAQSGIENPIIALIGDSTLFHAGLPAFINAVHNGARFLILVFDNGTTAMTGHQPPPNAPMRPNGERCSSIEILPILKATGALYVVKTSSFDVEQTKKAIKSGLRAEGVAVVISQGACALESRKERKKNKISRAVYTVNPEQCVGCRICIDQFGCAAFVWDEQNRLCKIDPILCDGCGVCVQICPREAFHELSN